MTNNNDTGGLVYRLRKRAEIRNQISTRKSVQEGKVDRLGLLLIEAADRIQELEEAVRVVHDGLNDAGEDPYVRGEDTALDILGPVYDRRIEQQLAAPPGSKNPDA